MVVGWKMWEKKNPLLNKADPTLGLKHYIHRGVSEKVKLNKKMMFKKIPQLKCLSVAFWAVIRKLQGMPRITLWTFKSTYKVNPFTVASHCCTCRRNTFSNVINKLVGVLNLHECQCMDWPQGVYRIHSSLFCVYWVITQSCYHSACLFGLHEYSWRGWSDSVGTLLCPVSKQQPEGFNADRGCFSGRDEINNKWTRQCHSRAISHFKYAHTHTHWKVREQLIQAWPHPLSVDSDYIANVKEKTGVCDQLRIVFQAVWWNVLPLDPHRHVPEPRLLGSRGQGVPPIQPGASICHVSTANSVC